MRIERFKRESGEKERERDSAREKEKENFVIDYIKLLSIFVNAECRRRS